jgi:Bacterial regulatory proteins, luxR family
MQRPSEVVIASNLTAHSGSGTECENCPVSRQRHEFILKLFSFYKAADKRLANLTHRQQEVTTMVLAGHQSKNIAADLHISRRTVENHRASGSLAMEVCFDPWMIGTEQLAHRTDGDEIMGHHEDRQP